MQVSTRGLRQVRKSSQSIGVRTALGQALLSTFFLPLSIISNYADIIPTTVSKQLHTTSPFQQSLPNRGCLLFFPRHRWQPAGSTAHLREERKQLGPKVPLSRRVHRDKQTRLSNHEPRTYHSMKVIVKQWHAIAQWQWDTGKTDENGDPEEDVCGICRVPFEGCCPTCKVPGDDCPLSRSLLSQTHPLAVADHCLTFASMGRV
jgi:hypothetical protein